MTIPQPIGPDRTRAGFYATDLSDEAPIGVYGDKPMRLRQVHDPITVAIRSQGRTEIGAAASLARVPVIAAPVSGQVPGRRDEPRYGILYCIRAALGVSGVCGGEPGFVPRSQGPHLLEASMSMDDSIRPCSLRASG